MTDPDAHTHVLENARRCSGAAHYVQLLQDPLRECMRRLVELANTRRKSFTVGERNVNGAITVKYEGTNSMARPCQGWPRSKIEISSERVRDPAAAESCATSRRGPARPFVCYSRGYTKWIWVAAGPTLISTPPALTLRKCGHEYVLRRPLAVW